MFVYVRLEAYKELPQTETMARIYSRLPDLDPLYTIKGLIDVKLERIARL